jgi:hypothetical protein
VSAAPHAVEQGARHWLSGSLQQAGMLAVRRGVLLASHATVRQRPTAAGESRRPAANVDWTGWPYPLTSAESGTTSSRERPGPVPCVAIPQSDLPAIKYLKRASAPHSSPDGTW